MKHFKIFTVAALWLLSFTGPANAAGYVVSNGSQSISLSDEGEITSITTSAGSLNIPITLNSTLEKCSTVGNVVAKENTDGSIEFERQYTDSAKVFKCTFNARYYSTPNSIKCDLVIKGLENPWSAPINTTLKFPAGTSRNLRYWTAWGSPNIDTLSLDPILKKELKEIKGGCAAAAGWAVLGGEKNNRWVDPLVPVPFTTGSYSYGAPSNLYTADPMAAFVPAQNDLFAIPMATVIDDSNDVGLTVGLSPQDRIIDLQLLTTADGSITFRRLSNRISQDNVIKFSFDIIVHEGDWRPAVEWYKSQYPDYMLPKNSLAQKMGGTATYSAKSDIDNIEELRDKDYSVNWQASFDFPYMGMFIPPVGLNEPWTTYGYVAKVRSEQFQTITNMNNIAKAYKAKGVYSLNYFNVAEFGAGIVYPKPAPVYTNESDLWKNSNDFLYTKLPNAILPTPEQSITDPSLKNSATPVPIGTWGGGVVMDCGDPDYAKFLIDQARKHIQYIPDSYGICIDRLDWLRMYNERATDGMTWYNGKPARSLINSWKQLMDTIGPIMHNAGKVIFVNNHTKRIDLLNHVDGIFDEFTYMGNSLNLMALNCFYKPALGWVDDASTIEREGGDSFMQKYLYMGVFPMCPSSSNDHAVLPTPYVDKYYQDYGFMLKMMKGREWVLKPHVVKVENYSAKANVFKIESGYIVPVVYGDNSSANISIKGLDLSTKCYVFYPGVPEPKVLELIAGGNGYTLTVPLERGCAMLYLFDKSASLNPKSTNDTIVSKINSNISLKYKDFSSNFNLPLELVKVAALPLHGNLRLQGTDVSAGQVIEASQIKSLQYIPNVDYLGADKFTWKGECMGVESNVSEMELQIQAKKVLAIDIDKKKLSCNSLDAFNSKSSNLVVDSSNPGYFDGNVRITRSSDTDEYFVVKHDENIRRFEVLVYGYGSAENLLKFFVSPDANTWAPVSVNSGIGVETATSSHWFRKVCYPLTDLGLNNRYLKIELVPSGVSWGTQVAEVSLGEMNSSQRSDINTPLSLPKANLYIDDASVEQLDVDWGDGVPKFDSSKYGVYSFSSTVALPTVGYVYDGNLAVNFIDSIVDITKGVAPLFGIDDFMGRDAVGNILYSDGTVAPALIANWDSNKTVMLGTPKFLSVSNMLNDGYSALPGWKINEGRQGRYAHMQRAATSDSYAEYVLNPKNNLELELLTNIITNFRSAIDVKVSANGIDWNSVDFDLKNTGITTGSGYYTLFTANIPSLPSGIKVARIYLKNGLDNLPSWAPQLLSVASRAYPQITWDTPSNIDYGSALTASQLNATADVPGTFVYTPAINTLLPVGIHELKVDFIPNDTVRYLKVSKSVNLEVVDATGIENVGVGQIKIYPNPFVSMIHISAKEPVQKVLVYNMAGSLVYFSSPVAKEAEVDLSHLDCGLYQVISVVGGEKIIRKLIKK